jgi:hypothetical protein
LEAGPCRPAIGGDAGPRIQPSITRESSYCAFERARKIGGTTLRPLGHASRPERKRASHSRGLGAESDLPDTEAAR